MARVQDDHRTIDGVTCGVVATLIWSAWPSISKLGVDASLTPWDIAALRFAVSGAVLFPFVWSVRITEIDWRIVMALVCGAGAPYTIVMVTGLTLAPAAHAGVVGPSTSLLLSIIGAALIFGDALSRARIFGMVTIVAGIAMIGWPGFVTDRSTAWVGDLLFVCGGILWAMFTIATRLAAVTPLQASALVAVVSAGLYLPPYALITGSKLLEAPIEAIAVQALYQGVLTAALCLVLHARSVRSLGVTRASLFPALVPATAVLLVVPILGTSPKTIELLGATIATVGAVIVYTRFEFRVPQSFVIAQGKSALLLRRVSHHNRARGEGAGPRRQGS